MFSRTSNLIRLACVQQEPQVRGMATLKMISMRLKSVKNIQKITKSMKMVSAAKYARAEKDLKPAKPYGIGASLFYEKAEVPLEAAPEKKKKLFVACASDRGLCGGVHSSISRYIKADIAANPDTQYGIICIGDKSRAQLQRVVPDKILFQVTEVGRRTATFEDASAIASEIINSDFDYTTGNLVYNRFKSVVSYKTVVMPIFTSDAVTNAPGYSPYDSMDNDILKSYMEYSLASLIFYTLREGACSEQSARMTAMENASKNAGEMIDKLTLTFNRTRQAVITGELIEIISGAAAL